MTGMHLDNYSKALLLCRKVHLKGYDRPNKDTKNMY